VLNKGEAPFDFQAALHSYFDLSDISRVSVTGSFHGKTFLNKMLKPAAEQVETRQELVVTEEYDRVYKVPQLLSSHTHEPVAPLRFALIV
jgi:glucose-6-phosphate 1-epimerase